MNSNPQVRCGGYAVRIAFLVNDCCDGHPADGTACCAPAKVLFGALASSVLTPIETPIRTYLRSHQPASNTPNECARDIFRSSHHD